MILGLSPIVSGIPVERDAQLRAGIKRFMPTDGFAKVDCDTCAAPMWIGPRQQAFMAATPDAPKLCTNCIIALAKEDSIGGIGHLGGKGGAGELTDGQRFGPEATGNQ